jgi:hypothetical protein
MPTQVSLFVHVLGLDVIHFVVGGVLVASPLDKYQQSEDGGWMDNEN